MISSMINLFKRLIYSEKGQALPIVLALMVLGGLTIAPSLNYAATTINHGRIIDKGINGIYAAEAGVEYALWHLAENTTPPTQLSENINQMEVTIQTEDKGTYTVYFDELIQADSHSDYLDVTGEAVWDSGDICNYTITVTWQPGAGLPTIHLTDIGARLPLGYLYQTNSAASFANNLSDEEPDEVQDASGAWMLNWELGPPYPTVTEYDPVETQTFYITGEEELEGDYVWVVANRDDIGEVGEMNGQLYLITATASRDSATTAKIVADVLMIDLTPTIVSWQITK